MLTRTLRDATLELTYTCNLRCTICAKLVDPPGPELTTPQWLDVVDQLEEMGCTCLWLTGGEPLCSKSFWPVLERAARYDWDVIVLTNCTMVESEAVRRLGALAPTWIQTTIFSSDPGIHDELAAMPGAHARTMCGLELLLAAGLPVRVKVPLVELNYPGLPAMEAWAQARGIPLMSSMKVFPRMDGESSALRFAVTDPCTIQGYVCDHGKDYNTAHQRGDDLLDCSAGKEFLAIGPSGDVYPCTVFPLPVDHVAHRPVEAIWSGAPSAALRRIRETRKQDMERIDACAASYCQRCPGISAVLEDDFRQASDGACMQCRFRTGPLTASNLVCGMGSA